MDNVLEKTYKDFKNSYSKQNLKTNNTNLEKFIIDKEHTLEKLIDSQI